MRIIYAGSPAMAVPALESLAAEFPVVGVLTNSDKVAGRGRRRVPTPVKEKAQELDLNLIETERLDTAVESKVAALKPDLLIAVAYGHIFPESFLALFPRGGLNLHPSLLPRYRGCSPIPAAILAGEGETGITVQRLAREMDSGDIVLQERFPLDGTETTAGLTRYAGERGAVMLPEAVRRIADNRLETVPQDGAAVTYCGFIRKDAGFADWSLPAVELERRYRAYTPWPGLFTTWEGRRLNLSEVALPKGAVEESAEKAGTVLGMDKKEGILVQTGSGILVLKKLQLQGRKVLDWRSFLNGNQKFKTAMLGG